ncbi:MAG: penicillin-binding transpeptidase domain-containing protein, partial [Pseudomonadota bacterium]
MSKESDQQRVYSRRSALLVGGKLVLLSALAGRMYYLQVVEAKRYRVLAEENRINLRLLIPPRGRLFDRFGVPIAVNREDYRAKVVAERAGDVKNTLDTLESIIAISKEDRERILKEVRKRRRFVPVTVNNDLTWKEVSQIEINAPDLPGVLIEEGLSRHYPYIDQCAHLLGYVGPATETEQESDKDPLMQLPDFRVGKSGIERQYEKVLRGKSGESQIEINASGRVLRELSRREGTAGKDLTLTIDAGLQTFAIKRLANFGSASAVVMDIHNGDVLAMANTPGYDPNAFIKGIKPKLWRSLVNNPKGPLTNKAIEGQYAPGSTFKVVVALAALESGRVSPYETFFCPGALSLGSAKFHCWKRGGHGTMNMHNGLKKSCD